MISGVCLHCERIRKCKRHSLTRIQLMAFTSFCDKEMFLRMWFTFIRKWQRVYPDVCLWYRFNLQKVQSKPGTFVNKSAAHWLAFIIQVNRFGFEAFDFITLFN